MKLYQGLQEGHRALGKSKLGERASLWSGCLYHFEATLWCMLLNINCKKIWITFFAKGIYIIVKQAECMFWQPDTTNHFIALGHLTERVIRPSLKVKRRHTCQQVSSQRHAEMSWNLCYYSPKSLFPSSQLPKAWCWRSGQLAGPGFSSCVVWCPLHFLWVCSGLYTPSPVCSSSHYGRAADCNASEVTLTLSESHSHTRDLTTNLYYSIIILKLTTSKWTKLPGNKNQNFKVLKLLHACKWVYMSVHTCVNWISHLSQLMKIGNPAVEEC